ncbi:MgtC/SapB family protein [Clostridium sardiniense]
MSIEDIATRLLLAIVIGGVVGYDREFKNRPAGFRTHILVCIGATVTALIEVELGYSIMKGITETPELSGMLSVDLGRISAQVISGIGFLGAGTIIRNKGSVKGLTTAASIWAVACVGLAIGMGFYTISILSAIGIVIALVFLKTFQNKFITKLEEIKFEVKYDNKVEAIKEIDDCLIDMEINIENIEFNLINENRGEHNFENTCVYTILAPQNIDLNLLICDLSSGEHILGLKLLNKGGVSRKMK